ncbi:MAG: hypothetical protein HY319_00410 [Armatimonadetes bacterium]|nr:hypothetical protein [Armatimonadota bacterium]
MGIQQREQALELSRELDSLPEQEAFERFFARIRDTEIPFYPCIHAADPLGMFRESFDALYILGRTVAFPMAIGLTMHLYMMSALAAAPLPSEVPLVKKRGRILRDLRQRRLLVAVASPAGRIGHRDEPSGDVVVEVRDGGYVARGRKAIQSMVSQADLLVFSAQVEGHGFGLFLARLRGEPALRQGPRVFSGPMACTDTRPLDFEELRLEEDHVLSLGPSQCDPLLTYAHAWFHALVSAVYLGGASRALEEARKFGRTVCLPDGRPVAGLDGFQMDVGRLVLELQTAVRQALSFGPEVARLTPADLPALSELEDLGAQIKYRATLTAEKLVGDARRLIGTRAMAADHPVGRLSGQILFGPLHPWVSAIVEREQGRAALGPGEYLGLPAG